MTRAKTLKNREQYFKAQMAALAETGLTEAAKTMKIALDSQGRALINFFNREYLAAPDGIKALDGEFITVDHQSVMAHYLVSKGQSEPSGIFVPISRLTGMVETGSSPSDHLITPLVEKFGENYGLFKAAAAKIGGISEGQTPSGGDGWLFTPLPKLPLQVVFFEADDEFPAEVKVLFDQNATQIVAYECLELLEFVLVMELLKAAGLTGGCGDGHGDGGHECQGSCEGHCDHHH